MSRGSQTKRAARAKDRARQRAREKQRERSVPTSNPFDPDGYFDSGTDYADGPPQWFEHPRFQRQRTARDLLEEVRGGRLLSQVIAEARAIEPTAFQVESEAVLVGWVRELYGHGWQPTELIRFARIRGKTSSGELVRLAVAAEKRSRRGPTTDDPRWLRQWADADLPRHQASTGWVSAWAGTLSGRDFLYHIFRVAVVLGVAPPLELLLPPPPGVRTAAPLVGQPAASSADPILGRVRALLAKAESTDHESEASAFTAKAQQLMTKHAIDLAMVANDLPGVKSPHLTRIPIEPPYADAKALLLQTVAEQTRCRTLHHADLAMSSVIGFPSDLAAVELLFTSLLVQVQHHLAEIGAGARPGARTRSQAFKAAFFLGFTGRIGARLAEVNRLAYADARADTFLPVLRSQSELIDEFISERFRGTISSQVRGGYDRDGYSRGALAGDAAALTAGAVTADPRPAATPPSSPELPLF